MTRWVRTRFEGFQFQGTMLWNSCCVSANLTLNRGELSRQKSGRKTKQNKKRERFLSLPHRPPILMLAFNRIFMTEKLCADEEEPECKLRFLNFHTSCIMIWTHRYAASLPGSTESMNGDTKSEKTNPICTIKSEVTPETNKPGKAVSMVLEWIKIAWWFLFFLPPFIYFVCFPSVLYSGFF